MSLLLRLRALDEAGAAVPDAVVRHRDAVVAAADAHERSAIDEYAQARSSTLVGRVLRDGAPVTRFAIVRKGFASYHWITDPAIIHAPDGRFALSELRESSCSVHTLAEGSAWAATDIVHLEPALRTIHGSRARCAMKLALRSRARTS